MANEEIIYTFKLEGYHKEFRIVRKNRVKYEVLRVWNFPEEKEDIHTIEIAHSEIDAFMLLLKRLLKEKQGIEESYSKNAHKIITSILELIGKELIGKRKTFTIIGSLDIAYPNGLEQLLSSNFKGCQNKKWFKDLIRLSEMARKDRLALQSILEEIKTIVNYVAAQYRAPR